MQIILSNSSTWFLMTVWNSTITNSGCHSSHVLNRNVKIGISVKVGQIKKCSRLELNLKKRLIRQS